MGNPRPGFGTQVEWDDRGSRFRIEGTCFRLQVRGGFNVSNALAAAAVGRALGLDDGVSAKALESFPGLSRRMEFIGEAAGVVLLISATDLLIVLVFGATGAALVADAGGAFVVETAGLRWATERVEYGARSISNA